MSRYKSDQTQVALVPQLLRPTDRASGYGPLRLHPNLLQTLLAAASFRSVESRRTSTVPSVHMIAQDGAKSRTVSLPLQQSEATMPSIRLGQRSKYRGRRPAQC